MNLLRDCYQSTKLSLFAFTPRITLLYSELTELRSSSKLSILSAWVFFPRPTLFYLCMAYVTVSLLLAWIVMQIMPSELSIRWRHRCKICHTCLKPNTGWPKKNAIEFWSSNSKFLRLENKIEFYVYKIDIFNLIWDWSPTCSQPQSSYRLISNL